MTALQVCLIGQDTVLTVNFMLMTQVIRIEKFATSLEVRYLQHFDSSVELPEDAYHGQDIVDHAENFIAEYGDKYVNAQSSERRKALVDYALPKNIAGLERDLGRYRITYDKWFRESTLHNDGSVQKLLTHLKKRALLMSKTVHYGLRQVNMAMIKI